MPRATSTRASVVEGAVVEALDDDVPMTTGAVVEALDDAVPITKGAVVDVKEEAVAEGTFVEAPELPAARCVRRTSSSTGSGGALGALIARRRVVDGRKYASKNARFDALLATCVTRADPSRIDAVASAFSLAFSSASFAIAASSCLNVSSSSNAIFFMKCRDMTKRAPPRLHYSDVQMA